jgi:hypothetical protein
MCGHQRFVFPLVLLLAASIASGAAFAKGGTLHLFPSEARTAIVSESVVSPIVIFAGCGRGRYREPSTQKCRGPADVAR